MLLSQARGADAHVHLADIPEAEDRLAEARALGIDAVVVVASDPARWEEVRAIAKRHRAAVALGVHPWWPDLEAAERLRFELDGVDAIGEIGLDHARAETPAARRAQRSILNVQLRLAAERALPVVLHAVRSLPEVLDALQEHGVSKGMLHDARRGDLPRALRAGLHLSFGPAVLKSRAALEAAARTPLERLLLESDAPYGARGPAVVSQVAHAIAHRRGMAPPALLTACAGNAHTLFGSR